jgi:hypothetical protein
MICTLLNVSVLLPNLNEESENLVIALDIPALEGFCNDA